MSNIQVKFPTETWVTATWEEYIRAIADPTYERAKSYYHNKQLRIEMTPLGHDRGSDNSIITFAVNLFCSLKGIAVKGLTNVTYRKPGEQEAQPDLSYYIGDFAQAIPYGTSIIDINRYPPPDLAIEISNTSLRDDLGEKRLLYEDLNLKEYWVVDVREARILAFAIADGGSKRITESLVFPGLAMSILEEALRRARETDHGQAGAWLLARFSEV